MSAPPPCHACGAAGAGTQFSARGLSTSDPAFVLRRCLDCGLGWTEPRLGSGEIGRWYPPAYYGKDNVRFNLLFELLVRAFRRRRARVVARRAKLGPVLDVGCGRGFILSRLRELGFTPFGLELNEAAAWHARHKLGLPVETGDLQRSSHRPGSLRAVIFWHVLEHMSRPAEALARARDLLSPGGLLIVAVPNSESLQARWFGPSWFHLDIPRHYYHFGTTSLTRLLSRKGFRVVQVDHFSFEQNPYGWLQSLYNALGLRYNLLYDILKSATARSKRLRSHPLQVASVVLLLPLFLPLSLAMTVVEAALRRGGTVEVYAVKK